MSKKGVKKTEEHKIKIGNANRGKKLPKLIGNSNGFKKGMIPWNKGKSIGKGENNPNWRGGNLYFRIFQRDNDTCQICGLHDKDVMEIDHKIPRVLRPDLKKEEENLWTLCANCHRRKTKRDWEEIKKSRVK